MKLSEIAKDHPDLVVPCPECSPLCKHLAEAWKLLCVANRIRVKDGTLPIWEDQIECERCGDRRFVLTPGMRGVAEALRLFGYFDFAPSNP